MSRRRGRRGGEGAAGPAGAPLPLARLRRGGQGRIADLLEEGRRRQAPGSPLRPGAFVQVLEANREWLHVRIDSREYSVPRHLAELVLVRPREGEEAAAADAYTVLVSRLDRATWRVRVVARSTGTVVANETFAEETAARRRAGELRRDVARLDAAAFRARHRLP